MPENPSPREQDAWRGLVLTAQLLEATLDRQLQQLEGIPHAYYGILIALFEQPEHRARMSDVAQRLRFSQSRLTHAVRRLEDQGLVERVQGDGDRRVVTVGLTHEGLQLIRRAAPKQAAEVRRKLLARLAPEQVEQLAEITAVLLEGLEEGWR